MTTMFRSAALTLGLCLASAPAFAHAHLKSSTPAANATVATAPGELDLTFSEGVNPKFTGVKVTGPGKAAVATGAATLGTGGDTTLVVPVSAPLTAGTYKVDWHALATDGHKTTGSYSFTIKP
jgi:copper resistance protein C